MKQESVTHQKEKKSQGQLSVKLVSERRSIAKLYTSYQEYV